MKYIFWILLSAFLLFLTLTIYNKVKNKKIKFLLPTILFLIPVIALSGVNIIYRTTIAPHPTTSHVLLEDSDIKIGHASKAQPKTLDEYIEIVSKQIDDFHKIANKTWPLDAFDNSVVYFITQDKSRAWKVEHNGSYSEIEDVTTVPDYASILGYDTEFHRLSSDSS